METFQQTITAPVYLQIARHIEQRIIDGELENGERLHTTQELARRYRVTPVTIQKSLEQLVKKDLLERVPRRGTFVKSAQTANTIGLVFGDNPFRTQSSYYSRLIDLFIAIGEKEGINLKSYVNLQENLDNSRLVFDLKDDIAAGKLKGLITIKRSPELSDWLESQDDIFWLDTPELDHHHATYTGMKYLRDHGFKKIKVVSMYPRELLYDNFIAGFNDEVNGCRDAYGKNMPEDTVVRWGGCEEDGYREAKKLFSDPSLRPDAIFINHDIVTKGAILALMELGLKIPGDVALLSHGNTGCSILSPVPLTTIVFDPEIAVKKCCEAIKQNLDKMKPGRFNFNEKLHGRLIPGKSCGE